MKNAFFDSDIEKFAEIMKTFITHITDDPILNALMPNLMKKISLKIITEILGSYKRITLKYLMNELKATEFDVERYLSELILTG